MCLCVCLCLCAVYTSFIYYHHNFATNVMLQNALNIIPLNSNVTEVKKVGYNGFTVGLIGKEKVFRYNLRASTCIFRITGNIREY